MLRLDGEAPRWDATTWSYAAAEMVLPHAGCRRPGWVSIGNPGARTHGLPVGLLRQAHLAAHRRGGVANHLREAKRGSRSGVTTGAHPNVALCPEGRRRFIERGLTRYI